MNCQLEINWNMNDMCNFDCVYCYPGSKENKFAGLKDTQRIVDGFNKTERVCLICMTGGEPFLFPNFMELCEKLVKKHIININTNLSHKNIFHFAETVNPEKIRCIHCALHIQERERLGLVRDFIKKYLFLKEKGFYAYPSYVLYPHLINRFKEDYAYFKSEGIILRPKLFRGSCNRFKIFDAQIFKRIGSFFECSYPEAYSKKQKDMIISYMEQSQRDGDFIIDHEEDAIKGRLSDVWLDKSFIEGFPSFKGKYCSAGKVFVRVVPTGEAYRCHDEKYYLGNLFEDGIKLFEEPRKCIANFCTCPYIGYRYVLKEDSNVADGALCYSQK